jgi:UDP-N-acetyl-D-glucosamine/UDP-N-acetyl-D-galactosamine dehydrogenase
VVDIYHTLQEYTNNITVFDPWANVEAVKREYQIDVVNTLPEKKYEAVILAIAHDKFKDLNLARYKDNGAVIFDVKNFVDRKLVDGRL